MTLPHPDATQRSGCGGRGGAAERTRPVPRETGRGMCSLRRRRASGGFGGRRKARPSLFAAAGPSVSSLLCFSARLPGARPALLRIQTLITGRGSLPFSAGLRLMSRILCPFVARPRAMGAKFFFVRPLPFIRPAHQIIDGHPEVVRQLPEIFGVRQAGPSFIGLIMRFRNS